MDFIETGHGKVDADGDLYLRFNGVLRSAVEDLHAEVLLDPLEEELDAPTALVDPTNGESVDGEVVGEKDQALPFPLLLVNETDAAELAWIVPFAPGNLQSDRLVAALAGQLVDRTGFRDVESHVALCACHEERNGSVDTMKPSVIHVSTINDIDASGLEGYVVEGVHVGDVNLSYADEHGNPAFQVGYGVQLDSGLGLPEVGPWKHGEAEVDGGGVQRVDHLFDVQPAVVVGVEAPAAADEDLSQIGVDPPFAALVSLGQVCSRDVAAQPHREEVAAVAQARLDVAQ